MPTEYLVRWREYRGPRAPNRHWCHTPWITGQYMFFSEREALAWRQRVLYYVGVDAPSITIFIRMEMGPCDGGTRSGFVCLVQMGAGICKGYPRAIRYPRASQGQPEGFLTFFKFERTKHTCLVPRNMRKTIVFSGFGKILQTRHTCHRNMAPSLLPQPPHRS